MTSQIDFLLKKWTLYKRCLIVFIVLNVFSISLSVVLGVYFFIEKNDLVSHQNENLRQIELIAEVKNELYSFTKINASMLKKTSFSKYEHKKIFAAFESWTQLKNKLNEVGLKLDLENFVDGLAEDNDKVLNFLNLSLQTRHAERLHSLRKNISEYHNIKQILIWTGVFTLVFGLLLPLLIIYLMTLAINKIRQELQHAIFDFVRNFTNTKLDHGNHAFKNPEFWLHILLLAAQSFSHFSAHPIAQVLSEAAHIIRLELSKKNNPASKV